MYVLPVQLIDYGTYFKITEMSWKLHTSRTSHIVRYYLLLLLPPIITSYVF